MAGRNKKDDYNNTVKVTINDDMADMLYDTVKITGKSKCDIIRDLIPIASSKDFEKLVPWASI